MQILRHRVPCSGGDCCNVLGIRETNRTESKIIRETQMENTLKYGQCNYDVFFSFFNFFEQKLTGIREHQPEVVRSTLLKGKPIQRNFEEKKGNYLVCDHLKPSWLL